MSIKSSLAVATASNFLFCGGAWGCHWGDWRAEKGDAHWPLYQSDDLGQSDPWVSAAVPLRGNGGDLILLASASLVWMAG